MSVISEIIDIRSVKNIILFSSDRQRLKPSTHRQKRPSKSQPTQKSDSVYDFVNLEPIEPDQHLPADWERYNWLSKLTETRGEWDGDVESKFIDAIKKHAKSHALTEVKLSC